MPTDADLSKLLWESREQAEMFADVVDSRAGAGSSTWGRGLVKRIDAYRATRGWSPDGFGGEVGGTEAIAKAARTLVDLLESEFSDGVVPSTILSEPLTRAIQHAISDLRNRVRDERDPGWNVEEIEVPSKTDSAPKEGE